jgi:Uma2 family endonuclease
MSTAVQKRVTDRPDPIMLRVPIEAEVVLADDVTIPAGIVDLASFRVWTHSDDFPDRGRIDFLNGTVFLDLSMEQLYDHNQVKIAIVFALYQLAAKLKIGRIFDDRTRVSMPLAEYSTEPDAMLVSFASLRSNRVREIPGRRHGVTELEGPPDLILEVVSDSSEEKDLTDRPARCFKAGVHEFWRVDARQGTSVFEVLRPGKDGYVPAEQSDGWLRSNVFGRWFRLVQSTDELGKPFFELLAKEDLS